MAKKYRYTNAKQRKYARALAKDVLTVLRSKKAPVLETGTYVTVPNLYDEYVTGNYDGDIQMQEILPRVLPNCRVCALGAMYLSRIRLYNEVTLRGFGHDVSFDIGQFIGQDHARLIETAFEKSTDFAKNTGVSHVDAVEATRFGYKYPDDKLRLRAIMNNILANNGEFTPRAGLKKSEWERD